MHRCYRFLITAIVLTGIFSLPASGEVYETGSLRGFILGDEPACAYDNWFSRTVEGLAVDGGYNDHIPPELDPQTRGFGNFEYIEEEDAGTMEALWLHLFQALWLGDHETAEGLIGENELPYEFVYFTDTETGNQYYMLRELINTAYVDTGFYAGPEDDVIGGFDYGWGLYIVNPDAEYPGVNIQVCHVNDDFIAPPYAVEAFLEGDFNSLALWGTGREVMSVEGEDYNNSRSLSDPSRNGNLPFQWFTEFFVDTTRSQGLHDLVIQVHSYDTESHNGEPTLQVSGGNADGYPNRPTRDLSYTGFDWVNCCPTIMVPANYCMEGQEEVEVQEMFAIWRGWGVTHIESGAGISRDCYLPGYPDSPQMWTCRENTNSYETYDHWLHFELDELPWALQDAEITELEYYAGTAPPTEANWAAFLRYFETSLEGLVQSVHNMYEYLDETPPTAPQSPYIYYAGDNFMEIGWSTRSYDPYFQAYEVYFGTTETINLDNTLWTIQNDPNLVGQNLQYTRVEGLTPMQSYGFRVRGVDMSGNVSELSTATAWGFSQEGSASPLAFDLFAPTSGDTCHTLDTTLVWYSTSDPDLYDIPRYDVWMDTLANMSTMWMVADGDSIQDTTIDVSGLLNFKDYYWTVRATDRNTEGTWANDTLSFRTYRPVPPAEFTQDYPLERSTLWNVEETDLVWNSTYDPDGLADITYQVSWATNIEFTENYGSFTTTDTFTTIDDLEINATVYWRVLAWDNLDTTWTDTWRFYTWTPDYPEFSLDTPTDGETVLNDTVTVTWTAPETSYLPEDFALAELDEQTYVNAAFADLPKGSEIAFGAGESELDDHGGPDSFGHVWIDNKEHGGPAFDWVDISEIGTLSDASNIDDGCAPATIPFPFTYYGEEYETVHVGSNGNMNFLTSDDADWSNSGIPNDDGPSAMIAPFWCDLRPNYRGDIYTWGDSTMFVVSWLNIRQYSHEEWDYYFQVILYPDGMIKFQYLNMDGDLDIACIGIENGDEDDGLQVVYNAAYLEDRIAILFTPDDYLYTVEWSASAEFAPSTLEYTLDNEFTITDVEIQQFLIQNRLLEELDELPDDITIYWRVNTRNLYSLRSFAAPGINGQTFTVFVPEPPVAFDMAYPANEDTVVTDTVTVGWNAAYDPDPDDTLTYVVQWSQNSDFSDFAVATTQDTFLILTGMDMEVFTRSNSSEFASVARKKTAPQAMQVKTKNPSKARQISGTALSGGATANTLDELDELPDDSHIFWRVQAVDELRNSVWANQGTDGWWFHVQVPEPPPAFALLEPENDDTLAVEEATPATLRWEAANDPDPNETTSYNLYYQYTQGQDTDTLYYSDLADTALVINLADSLGIEYWEETIQVTWWVLAGSENDTTQCDEDFIFHIAPNSAVPEKPFAGMPTEYSIAALYPNPFNPTATVVVGLPQASHLKVQVYNILGELVETVVNNDMRAGYHRLILEGSNWASGLYFVRAESPGQMNEVQRIFLVK